MMNAYKKKAVKCTRRRRVPVRRFSTVLSLESNGTITLVRGGAESDGNIQLGGCATHVIDGQEFVEIFPECFADDVVIRFLNFLACWNCCEQGVWRRMYLCAALRDTDFSCEHWGTGHRRFFFFYCVGWVIGNLA